MKRNLLVLILIIFAFPKVYCQSFSIDELITLSYMPSKNIDHYMSKKGFMLSASTSDSVTMSAGFFQKVKFSKKSTEPKRSIDIYIKDNLKNFTLHTTALNEYQEGERSLIKSGFIYDKQKDISKESSMLFQKANITVLATSVLKDGITQYSFDLKQKVVPSSLMYAEDLLQFDSHEFLVSFFWRAKCAAAGSHDGRWHDSGRPANRPAGLRRAQGPHRGKGG